MRVQRLGQCGVRDQGPWVDDVACFLPLLSHHGLVTQRVKLYEAIAKTLGVGTKGNFYFLFGALLYFPKFSQGLCTSLLMGKTDNLQAILNQ